MLQRISPRWSDLCVVAAPGPSLTSEIADFCRGLPVIAVNDAWRLFPFAAILYAADGPWWDCHGGCRAFAGERWSSHGDDRHNDKRACAERHGLNLVKGRAADGFSLDPDVIHYGDNSGFQAVNLAIHAIGAKGRVLLVGFDMRMVGTRRHFFGDHPPALRQTVNGYRLWPKHFEKAARMLPPGIEIVNCTPDSALTCFRKASLGEEIRRAA